MAPKSDWEFFNCSQDWEIEYVSNLYTAPKRVKKLIEEKCDDGTIHNWTHKQLYDYLEKKGVEKNAE